MSLKDQMQADLDLFLNLDEFAGWHDIDGRQVIASVDSDVNREETVVSERRDGVYIGEIIVLVRATDLPERPVKGQHIKLDGELHLVKQCSEDMGMFEIVLEANEA